MSITPAEQAEVRDLAAAAEQADRTAPLSEQFLLDLHPDSPSRHLLRRATDGSLAAYAQVSRPHEPAPAVELVVHPDHRRQGHGSALLAGLPDDSRIWAHGAGAAVDGFALARGLRVARELLVLERDLADPLPPIDLPAGFEVRPFRPGADDRDWVATNAAAFATHPEQGRLTEADLRQRTEQAWFDPAGLLLVVTDEPSAPIAGFHWTKIEPDSPDDGEVYVVGVHPAYQGRGLGRPVTLVGLHHLRERAARTAHLYVDADNPAAVRVYRSLGFTDRRREVMFVLPDHAG